MRIAIVAAILIAACSADTKAPPPSPADLARDAANAASRLDAAPAPDALVDIHSLEPAMRLDIRYATADNFAGSAVYPVARCRLRYAVARRLVAVNRALQADGFALKIWDCYRPISVQQKFWDLVGDPRYVAQPVIENGVPKKGSKHNRGAAVDLTLVDAEGEQVEMPTDYDDFSKRAHRDYDGATDAAKRHRKILRDAMEKQSFTALPTEWWHFDGPGWEQYPLSDEPL